jgi:hypothetical protein
MALTVVFEAAGMTKQQYDQVMSDLATQGESEPEGRTAHIASEMPGGWLVVDVWDTPEQFHSFAGKLIPVLQGAGVTPPEPRVLPTHNVIAG